MISCFQKTLLSTATCGRHYNATNLKQATSNSKLIDAWIGKYRGTSADGRGADSGRFRKRVSWCLLARMAGRCSFTLGFRTSQLTPRLVSGFQRLKLKHDELLFKVYFQVQGAALQRGGRPALRGRAHVRVGPPRPRPLLRGKVLNIH